MEKFIENMSRPITAAERDRILLELNNTKTDYPNEKTLQELFEAQAGKTPERTGLIFRDKQLTYGQLNERSNQLARVLREKGVRRESIVGIMVERSLEMMVGIMAILKAGGAYLPISPDYPAARIRFMLEDSGALMLLTRKNFVKSRETLSIPVIDLDNDANYRGESVNLSKINTPRDLAYVIYTSGSTGTPKGVMIEHTSAVNILMALQKEYPLLESDSYLLKTPYTFDISVTELFGWFWGGGRLVILEPGAEKDPAKIIRAIEKHGITHLNFVPSMFKIFLSVLTARDVETLNRLKYIFSVGEAVSREIVQKFYSLNLKVKYENLYGPTEATIYATRYALKDLKDEINVPIGKPFPNLQTYIVDENNNLLPPGVAGELCLAGTGLARGYLKRPELTAERFVNNPFVDNSKLQIPDSRLNQPNLQSEICNLESYSKMYKTGDLVRWMEDGNIQFLGRMDQQVKIRGYRIEPGEIESQLLTHEAVKDAVVINREDQDGNQYLCAYLVSERELTVMELRDYLARKLPDYMIPSSFVPIAKIPLNPSGKLDRKALPEPDRSIGTGRDYEAPGNELERKIAEIWREVLGIELIGINDRLFELGGQSLLVIQIAAKFQQQQINASIDDILTYQSIKELAQYLSIFSQEHEPVKTIREAEELFRKEFGGKGEFITCRVSGLDSGTATFYVFYVEDSLTTRRDDIASFFNKYLTRELLPHYILPLSWKPETTQKETAINNDQFTAMLRLEKKDVNTELENINAELEKSEARHNQAILSNESIKKYGISPVQTLLMVVKTFTGSLFYFEHYVDRSLLEDAFLEIIKEQGILRSILVNENGQFWCREFAPPEKIALPYFDLSGYDLNTQQQIMNHIMEPLYHKGFPEGSVLYRAACYKKNLREYVVTFTSDHLINDGIFEEILGRNLFKNYCLKEKHQEIIPDDIKSYSDYVAQVNQGPQNISEDEVIRKFDLEGYAAYNKEVEEIAVKQRTVDLKLTVLNYPINIDQTFDEGKIWEVAFATFIILLKRYFGFDRVPVKVMSYGRRYGQNSYFGTLGICFDSIPMLVPVDENQPGKMVEYVYDKIESASEHNINFYKISFDIISQQKWLKIAQLITPQKIEPFNQMLIFNYLGKFSGKRREEFVLLDEYYKKINQDTKVCIFYVDIRYTVDSIMFYLTNTVEHDTAKLKKMLDEVAGEVMGKIGKEPGCA
jgi:amino acid adenylation domain-containing protein